MIINVFRFLVAAFYRYQNPKRDETNSFLKTKMILILIGLVDSLFMWFWKQMTF